MVGPNGYDQILCTCICIMHPDVHDKNSWQCKLIKSEQSYRVYVLFWNSSNNVFKDWGIFTASGVVQVLIWF